MANIANSAQSCAFQTLALSTMGVDSIWDTRLTAYLAAMALQQADCEYGDYDKAHEEAARADFSASANFGPDWRRNPRALATVEQARKSAAEASDRWVERYCEPFWQAGRDLAMTPAPTIAAAMFKAELIKIDEIWNDSQTDRDCVEIIAEDMARLTTLQPSSDEAVISAFQRIQQERAALAALPGGTALEGAAHTSGEAGCWANIDGADKAIHETPATTPEGIACKLWLAIIHSEVDHETEQAALACDLEWFEQQGGAIDWNLRQLVSALRDLKTMEG